MARAPAILLKGLYALMGHLYEIMDDGLHSFADAIELAKAKTHAISALTVEDMHKVAEYVQRDVEDLAHVLEPKNKEELSAWLKFDVDLVENFALEAFLGLADKTSVDLAALKRHGELRRYYTGEISSPGTLTCMACAKPLVFTSTSIIPECHACGAKAFTRMA
jgi:hypothetical protein